MKGKRDKDFIGFQEAFDLTIKSISPLDTSEIPLSESLGYVSSGDVSAKVDSPSANVSMKDGYAVRWTRILSLSPGMAVRILTGARLPIHADTVIAEELISHDNTYIEIKEPVPRGQDILSRGSDVTKGEVIVESGNELSPGGIGLLAAGGHHVVSVYRKPTVALIATGDEVVLPGQPLSDGQLYASNLMTLHAWCRRYGMTTEVQVIPDKESLLKEKLIQAVNGYDAVITSGGAWTGDRDFMAGALSDLGWEVIYHRVRLGPGKAVGFGLLQEKPVFILPGGPPSNLVAFLQLVLPGLLKLSGHNGTGLSQVSAILEDSVKGQYDWTDAIFGRLESVDYTVYFHPLKAHSRLKNMAGADALLKIPEGITQISDGQVVTVDLLTQIDNKANGKPRPA
ncbi:MAG: molybdopterin molybdotransferase MoeA [Deltaproteobacteria bacterium]|nr:molybdopterin molybdotransferase MoeA [Deltaproteobacteria bacterium]